MSCSPNKLLASLSASEYRRIAPRLHTVRVSNGTTLAHCGVTRVYFPGTGVCSITSRMDDGSTIEVASIGNEGVVGTPALGSQLGTGCYLQVTHGTLQYMALHVFNRLCHASELGRAVDRYSTTFMNTAMQMAACNRLHRLDARCARWLMSLYDRVGRANFELTQPFLAMALGIGIAELSSVMAALVEAQVIKYDAASITVLDAIALRRRACPCYRVFQNYYRVLQKSRSSVPSAAAADRSNVIPMRMASNAVCSLCGLSRNSPHKTHSHCLRALDEELRILHGHARQLTDRRSAIAAESMLKFGQFLNRKPS